MLTKMYTSTLDTCSGQETSRDNSGDNETAYYESPPDTKRRELASGSCDNARYYESPRTRIKENDGTHEEYYATGSEYEEFSDSMMKEEWEEEEEDEDEDEESVLGLSEDREKARSQLRGFLPTHGLCSE